MNRKPKHRMVHANLRRMALLFRIRQENDMVDSAPQWEAVLRRQKEKTQADPNNRRSRHRSRSYVDSFYTLIQKHWAWSSVWILGQTGLSLWSLPMWVSSAMIILLFICHTCLLMFATFVNYVWNCRSWSMVKPKCHPKTPRLSKLCFDLLTKAYIQLEK